MLGVHETESQAPPVATDPAATLDVNVVAATASGPTLLAAFDGCLVGAGVHNFNLIRLSSVIPPGTTVSAGPVDGQWDAPVAPARYGGPRWGDRLYAVWAHIGTETRGSEAWAGVGWVQDPETGAGLFVEHEGHSECEVRDLLAASLSSIAVARDMEHLPHHSVVTGVHCVDHPVAALVVAPFQSAPWA